MPATEMKRAIIDKEDMSIVFGFKRLYQFVFGREITLLTDNKPLELILGPRKGIPITADNRLHRYAYYLSGFKYKIEHVRSEKNANVDALSRLPIEDNTDLSDMIDPTPSHVYFFQRGKITFDCKMLVAESIRDVTIREIIKYIKGDWSKNSELTNKEKIYFNKRFELTVKKGCLFWGVRACIPVTMRSVILKELHAIHFGMIKMKMFARLYVHWPGIDLAIENLANACKTCVIDSKKPNKTPLTTWPWPNKVWRRIHCDYAELYGEMCLIFIDAHSKWPEVINCKRNTKAKKLIYL